MEDSLDHSNEIITKLIFKENDPSRKNSTQRIKPNVSITPQHRKKLIEIFKSRDADKSGDLDEEELRNIFKDLGLRRSAAEIRKIISSYTRSSANKMTYEEFESLFSYARLLDVFNEIDRDESGTIDSTEVIVAMRKLGYRISKYQCRDMFKRVDEDESEEITFDEFRQAFELVPLATLETIADHWTNALLVKDCGSDFTYTTPTPQLFIWQTLLCEGMAGIISRTVTAPLEKLKIAAQTGRYLTQGGKYPMARIITELRSIVSTLGVRGLFAGNLTNCIRVFPTAGIGCTTYTYFLSHTSADVDHNAMEPLYRLMCGGAAALVTCSVMYPMDIIRARVTVSQSRQGILDVFREITSQRSGIHGFYNLYTGIRPTLLAAIPFIAVQNTVIDVVKGQAVDHGVEASPMLLLTTGAVAGLLAQTLVYPLDMFKRRMQVYHTIDPLQANANAVAMRIWNEMKGIVRDRGIKGLYAGLFPTFLKTVPAVATFSFVSEKLTEYFRQQNKNR